MLLIRHGQSHFNAHYNKTRIDPGIVDPGLTAEGEQQIRAAGAALAWRDIRRIITSPYRRTLESAAILAECLGLPISVEPLVRERSYFTCDIGTPCSELTRNWPMHDFSQLPEIWWCDPEESEADLETRCASFHAAMARVEDWPQVLVVSHYAFIQGLTGQAIANGAMVTHDPTGTR
ncbi:MAG: histidine phosphatase family protein [Kiloniellales bacterium]